MRLADLTTDLIIRAIDIYLAEAHPGRETERRPEVETWRSIRDALATFDDESQASSGRRFALRLGCGRYPHMKLVLEESFLPGDYYFAVDPHDDLRLPADSPDHTQWMAVKERNQEIKDAIESRWSLDGIPTRDTCSLELSVSARPAAPPPVDLVRFSVFAPRSVEPGSSFLLDVWAYQEEHRNEALQRALAGYRRTEVGSRGPLRIERGTDIVVLVDLPGFVVPYCDEVIAWEGEIGNATFEVAAPAGLEAGRHLGRIRLLGNGVVLARIHFEISVGRGNAETLPCEVEQHRVRSVFASYSSSDRPEVLRWKRGAEAAGVDVFVDVLSLRTGQDWEARLVDEITGRDLFCLFWSEAAARSEWVEKEWRCALSSLGCDHIQPVPLADPRQVPPPRELARCSHFEDLTRIVLEYEETFRRQ